MTVFLDAALSYARRGWPVFPCAPRAKRPLTEHGCKDATTDEAQIVAWWRETPDANVAMATGLVSDTYIVDVDDGGEVSLRGRSIPPTMQVRTGGGGRHIYFRRPFGEKWGNTAKRLPGIDTRGDGGYVMMPPSVHPDTGRPWLWVTPMARQDPAPAPLWVIDVYGLRRRPVAIAAPRMSGPPPSGYGEKALAIECAEVSGCAEGGRNHQVNKSAFSLGTLVGARLLDEGRVRADLMCAAVACGLSEHEAGKAIESGIRAGMNNPRQVQTSAHTPSTASDGGTP